MSDFVVESFDRCRTFLPSKLSKVDIVGMTDRELAPLVARKLDHRQSILRDQRQDVARQRAERAASRLAQGPRRGSAVLMSPPLLLRDLLADAWSPLIVFRMDEVDLPYRRSRLWQVARVVFDKDDLRCWVDPLGLHLRWNGGRGGLNLVADSMPSKPVPILTVDLRQPVDVTSSSKKPEPHPADILPEYTVDDVPAYVLPPPSSPVEPKSRAAWFDFSVFL